MTTRHLHPVTALLSLTIAVAVAGCGSAPAPTPTTEITASPTASPTPTPTSTPEATATGLPAGMDYADLDGVAVSTDLAHRLPLAIMIDDNKVARPQSGFAAASIVYQAPADGGEDRYMLVFQQGTAVDIGPVRSARPYFVYWAAEYRALYGHYGGDSESLKEVIPDFRSAIYDMDALRYGSCPYHRIATRVMPHNGYTNSAAMIGCLAKRGYPTVFQGVPRRSFVDGAPEATAAVTSITIPYRTCVIGYEYDAASNSYFRSVDGKRHIDAADSSPVKPSNVVVLFQPLSTDPVTKRPIVGVVGSGKALIFRDGKITLGTWTKETKTSLTRFYDAAGAEIALVRGQTFIQSVPVTTKVEYK